MHFSNITRYSFRLASTKKQVTRSSKQMKYGSDHSIKGYIYLYLIIFKKEIFRTGQANYCSHYFANTIRNSDSLVRLTHNQNL